MDEKRKFQSLDAQTQQMLDRAIDRVIDGTDHRIRAVPGYKRKLYQSILQALEYADRLIEQVPSPIDLDSDQFVFDPYLRAFFPTKRGLMQLFQQSSELKEYFEDIHHTGEAESYALLCMREYDETVVGMELKGEQVIKDVKQTRVTFAGHRIYAPARSESDVRRELKCCIFEGLVDNALARISTLRKHREQLEAEQQILNSRLRSRKSFLQFEEDEQLPLTAASEQRNETMQLQQIEQELGELGYVTPETCLGLVNEILTQPEQFVDLHNISMKVDKSGIRRDNPQPSDKVCDLHLSEVTIKGHPPRVVTLARINRKELVYCTSGC
ncbi:MAG: hypothetical protein PVI52_05085, partial [Chromatiales bacterium]